jgi:hypothetical protein
MASHSNKHKKKPNMWVALSEEFTQNVKEKSSDKQNDLEKFIKVI